MRKPRVLPVRYGMTFILGGVLALAAAYATLGFEFRKSALWQQAAQQIEARFLLHSEGQTR